MVAELMVLPELPAPCTTSVVVTAHNYGRYLPAMIRSVQAQTHDAWECVIVDDGSTDDTKAVVTAAAAADARISYLRSGPGQNAATMAGLKAARGDIMLLLDADDEVLPDRCARVTATFRAYPRAGFVVHPLFVIDDDRTVVGRMPLAGSMARGDLRADVVAARGVLHGFGVTSGMAVRREVVQRMLDDDVFPTTDSRFDEVLRRCAPLITEVAAVDEPLGLRRVHTSNMSGSRRQAVTGLVTRARADYLTILTVQQRMAALVDAGWNPRADDDIDLLTMAFVEARLTGSQATAERTALRNSSALAAAGRGRRWFWRLALLAPPPVLAAMVRELYAPDGVKLLLNHLRMRRHGRPALPPGLHLVGTGALIRRTLRVD